MVSLVRALPAQSGERGEQRVATPEIGVAVGADEEHGSGSGAPHDVLDQQQGVGVGAVQVVEDQQSRPVGGDLSEEGDGRLEQAQPGGRRVGGGSRLAVGARAVT